MISIRLQRTGRKNHAQFRMVVQESRRTPTSGKVIANLGFYNPHTKEHGIDFKQVEHYLKHGAQPSDRVIYFLTTQKVDLPKWVKKPTTKKSTVKNPDKLRRNQATEPKSQATQSKPLTDAKASSDDEASQQTSTKSQVADASDQKSETSETE